MVSWLALTQISVVGLDEVVAVAACSLHFLMLTRFRVAVVARLRFTATPHVVTHEKRERATLQTTKRCSTQKQQTRSHRATRSFPLRSC
jgi:hypothetical protein